MLDCQDTGSDPIIQIADPIPSVFSGDFAWVVAGYFRSNSADANLINITDGGAGTAIQILWQNTSDRFRVIHSNANTRTMNLAASGGLTDGTPFLLAGFYKNGTTPGTRAWLKAPGLSLVSDNAATGSTDVAGLTVTDYKLFGSGWQGAMAFAMGTGTMEESDFEAMYDAFLGTNDAEAGGGSLNKLLDAFAAISTVTRTHDWGFRHYAVGVNGSSSDVEGANVGDAVDASSTSRLQVYDSSATPARADRAANVSTVNGTVTIMSPFDAPYESAFGFARGLPGSGISTTAAGATNANGAYRLVNTPNSLLTVVLADNSRAVRGDETGGVGVGDNPGNWQHGLMEAMKSEVAGIMLPFIASDSPRWGLGGAPVFGANCVQIDGTTESESWSRLASGSTKSGGVGPGLGTLIPPYSTSADEARLLIGPVTGTKILAGSTVRARVLFAKTPNSDGPCVTLYPEKAATQGGSATSAGSSFTVSCGMPSAPLADPAFIWGGYNVTDASDFGVYSAGGDWTGDVEVGDTIVINANSEWSIGKIATATPLNGAAIALTLENPIDSVPGTGDASISAYIASGDGEPGHVWSDWFEFAVDATNIYKGFRVRNNGEAPVLAITIELEVVSATGIKAWQFGWGGNGVQPQREEFWSDDALKAFIEAIGANVWIQFNANQSTTVQQCEDWVEDILVPAIVANGGDVIWLGGPENATGGTGPGVANDQAILDEAAGFGVIGLSLREDTELGTMEEQWTDNLRADEAHLSHRGNTAVMERMISVLAGVLSLGAASSLSPASRGRRCRSCRQAR